MYGNGVVFTGDTRPCNTVAELSRGADVLVCVCVSIQSEIDGKTESREGKYMCGTTAAGKLAQEAEAKKLVLVHNAGMAQRGKMEKAIVDTASVYDGEIIWGEELMEVPL